MSSPAQADDGYSRNDRENTDADGLSRRGAARAASAKESLPPEQRARYQLMIAIAEKWSEPWITFFKAPEMKTGLTRLGFQDIEDLGPKEIGARYFRKGRPLVGHIVRARKSSTA